MHPHRPPPPPPRPILELPCLPKEKKTNSHGKNRNKQRKTAVNNQIEARGLPGRASGVRTALPLSRALAAESPAVRVPAQGKTA
jgi:hypothetical protein